MEVRLESKYEVGEIVCHDFCSLKDLKGTIVKVDFRTLEVETRTYNEAEINGFFYLVEDETEERRWVPEKYIRSISSYRDNCEEDYEEMD